MTAVTHTLYIDATPEEIWMAIAEERATNAVSPKSEPTPESEAE